MKNVHRLFLFKTKQQITKKPYVTARTKVNYIKTNTAYRGESICQIEQNSILARF